MLAALWGKPEMQQLNNASIRWTVATANTKSIALCSK